MWDISSFRYFSLLIHIHNPETAKRNRSQKKKSEFEWGITPGKVAYMYGVSPETFKTWITESQYLREVLDSHEKYDYSIYESRKWTPFQLQTVFDVFGDSRDYRDIIHTTDLSDTNE